MGDKSKKDKEKKQKQEQGKHKHVNKYADLIGAKGNSQVIDVIAQKNSKEFTPHLGKPDVKKDQYTRMEAEKHKNDPQRRHK